VARPARLTSWKNLDAGAPLRLPLPGWGVFHRGPFSDWTVPIIPLLSNCVVPPLAHRCDKTIDSGNANLSGRGNNDFDCSPARSDSSGYCLRWNIYVSSPVGDRKTARTDQRETPVIWINHLTSVNLTDRAPHPCRAATEPALNLSKGPAVVGWKHRPSELALSEVEGPVSTATHNQGL